jgi:hypothetical protein
MVGAAAMNPHERTKMSARENARAEKFDEIDELNESGFLESRFMI